MCAQRGVMEGGHGCVSGMEGVDVRGRRERADGAVLLRGTFFFFTEAPWFIVMHLGRSIQFEA